MASDQIHISQLKVDGVFGVSERERRHEQTLIVDITLCYDTSQAGETDDLKDTVSYSEVARAVVELAQAQSYKLVEKFVADSAKVILEKFPVQSVRVKARKMNPSARAYMNYASVEIERSK